ncbi:MAG: phosphopantetheine-binding protein [Erysipelotrichaceae bacterium]|nr:phosphopantetheine-binding protein [Erysipelotrichaceae bacterium]MDP3305384.1 phosphopantetheine-binding protein [Erysipelotrichaceae bacterium]
MIDKIRQVFSEVTQIDRNRLTLNARLKEDLLLDSLTTLELILELEGEFDIQFHNEELKDLRTFQDVVFAIESKTKS